MISSSDDEIAELLDKAFQSRNRGSFDFKPDEITRIPFIELEFQSRNRGSFDFKSAASEVLRYVLSAIAIPRATRFGTRGDRRNISRIGSKHGS